MFVLSTCSHVYTYATFAGYNSVLEYYYSTLSLQYLLAPPTITAVVVLMETSGKDTTDEVMCHYCYEQWDHMMYTQVTSRSEGNRRKRKWSVSILCIYVCVHAHARAMCVRAHMCMWV